MMMVMLLLLLEQLRILGMVLAAAAVVLVPVEAELVLLLLERETAYAAQVETAKHRGGRAVKDARLERKQELNCLEVISYITTN